MPLTALCGIIGALSISSFPLTSGFVSKSMISTAASDQHLAVVWFLLAAASAGVFLHAGIKFPWFVFFQKDSGLRPPEPPWNMRAAMILMSAICIGLGVAPGPLYALLPFRTDYVPYTGAHVVFQLQLLLFSGLAFFLMLGLLKRTLTITLDVDWFWRRFGAAVMRKLDRWSDILWIIYARGVVRDARNFVRAVYEATGPGGALARAWPTGLMAFWTAALLAAFLVVSYL
jgi:multicomponent Na+:H+ antiporter subunit D